ncbi:10662_t:CDS:10, partial [Racocetra fulgida]
PEEARQKRIELDAQVRRKHREQLITAKRIKHNLDAYQDDDAEVLRVKNILHIAESEFDLTFQDIEKLKSGLNDSDRESRLSSLKDLSTYLADPPDTLNHFVVNDNCIDILIVCFLITFRLTALSLQDQAAWAIGNLAAEAPECRDLLRANDVLVPLIELLNSKTTCFALSNLARGPNANLDEFFSAGITQHLLFYLEAEERMRPFNHGPLALPLIRTLGNIASGPDDNTDILIQQPDFLPVMLEYIQSDCSRRPEVLIKVFNTGFIPILSTIATHTNFDIRKEAAYSLLNIASHGEEYMRSLPHQDLLPEFVRSQDIDLIRLGLGYIELLLTQVQNGQQLMEQMQGIDALESVTLLEEPSLRDTSTRLMDKYFGEDFYSNINEVQLVE